ncbi:MAG: FAD-dependent oxidoreductase [Thermoleophilia bacterium]|nr:FAD-dependent oxidoreductase [Thermoleophilia bacterium]
MSYAKLLEPAQIGSVRTRNRTVKTGASTCYWHSDDVHMSEKAKAYYSALAKGGVGLLIVESPVVDWPCGTRWKERFRADDDRYIVGLAELAAAIHQHGCPTFMQLWHDGPWQSPLFAPPAMFQGPPIGASPVNLDTMLDFHRDVPRPLSIPEIEDIVDKFAGAATRVQKAGFEGVDINAASSHILHNFLSRFWNRREDAYGGSVENRARFVTEVVREIKRRTGDDFGVSVLINGIELGRAMGINDAACLSHADALQVARLLQEAGADAIQVRNHWLGYHVGGFFPDYFFYPEPPIPPERFPKEYNAGGRGVAANVHLASSMKAALSIPVILVGKLDPELGERYLQEGKADFIAMTRRLQADPELPNKLAAGRRGDIAPCTACGTCLDQSLSMERRCRINAHMGTTNYSLAPAETLKRVVVIGGGPAGMEAARVAALRGHRVTLLEKSKILGGLMPMAALVKGSEPENLPDMIAYHERQIRQLGVRVQLGTEADPARVLALNPDAVVVATGGKLTIPDIQGVGGPNVLTAPALHARVKPYLRALGPKMLDRFTRFWLPAGKSVVVIGGGFQGCEVAEFLIKRGRKVSIVEPGDMIGKGVLDFRLGLLMDWFERKGVELVTGAADLKVTATGVSFTLPDGATRTIQADTVMPTSPLDPDTSLAESLEGKVAEVYAVGDCREPNMIVDAVASGWRVGQLI